MATEGLKLGAAFLLCASMMVHASEPRSAAAVDSANVVKTTPAASNAATAPKKPAEVESERPAEQPKAAGPFGLRMGMTRAELEKFGRVQPAEGGAFKLSTVPKPHDEFEAYIVMLTEGQGLCKVVALGKDVSTSVFGTELQRTFVRVRDALTKKYGEGRHFDQLRPGSIWNEPQDWMMGLVKKERFLTSIWSEEHGSKLVDNIYSVGLEALAMGREKGFVRLSYEFENFEKCKAEHLQSADDAL